MNQSNLEEQAKRVTEKVSSWKCVKTLTEDSGLVYSVSTSPSGNILVSGAGKNTVIVWNLRTDKIIHTFKNNADCVYCVAVSPDGQTFASSGSNTTISISNLKTGLPIRTIVNLFSGHSRYIHSLAFSPNSQMLASGSADTTIKIWDLKTDQIIHTLIEHTGCVLSIAISQDGKTLVSGSGDHTIKIWNLNTGKLKYSLTGHSDSVLSVSISPDGQTIASGSFDKTIRVWNLKNSNLQTGSLVWTSPTGDSYIHSVAINSDGQTLASMNGSKMIQIWDLKTGKLLQTLTDHTADNWSSGLLAGFIAGLGAVPVTVYFGSDEDTLISATHGKIRIWERESVTSRRTAKYYEKLIYERTDLAGSSDTLAAINDECIYELSKLLRTFLSADEELIDILSVRYKGENSYLIVTDTQFLCLPSSPNFTLASKKFCHQLSKIQNSSSGSNGLSWYHNNFEFRVYFNSGKLNERISSFISISNVTSIPNDEFEEKYQKSNLLTGCGCLTVIAALIVWGFSSCVGTVFQRQPSTPSQATTSESTSPTSPSSGRTLLGSGPTGYTLWRDSDGCVYVNNLAEGDLARMNVSIQDFKKVVKEQTGSQCVFFE